MPVIGVLTAGGDCPGLNAVIRGVVTRAVEHHDSEVVGILNGWDGLMEGQTRSLGRNDVRGILQRGGTILGTSRRDPYVHGDGWDSCEPTIRRNAVRSVPSPPITMSLSMPLRRMVGSQLSHPSPWT